MPLLTRRRVLSAAAVVAAAGAGVGAGFLRPVRHPVAVPPAVPRADRLQAALTRERALLAALDATATVHPSLAGAISILRADHQAHLDATTALITEAGAVVATPDPSGTATSRVPAPTALRSRTELALAERVAAAAWAADSAALAGSAAAVAASISAAEAGHAAWLT